MSARHQGKPDGRQATHPGQAGERERRRADRLHPLRQAVAEQRRDGRRGRQHEHAVAHQVADPYGARRRPVARASAAASAGHLAPRRSRTGRARRPRARPSGPSSQAPCACHASQRLQQVWKASRHASSCSRPGESEPIGHAGTDDRGDLGIGERRPGRERRPARSLPPGEPGGSRTSPTRAQQRRRRGSASRPCRRSAPAAPGRSRATSAVRRTDAVEALVGRRHADRAAGVGAEPDRWRARGRPRLAEPEEEPPGTRPGAAGFGGVP